MENLEQVVREHADCFRDPAAAQHILQHAADAGMDASIPLQKLLDTLSDIVHIGTSYPERELEVLEAVSGVYIEATKNRESSIMRYSKSRQLDLFTVTPTENLTTALEKCRNPETEQIQKLAVQYLLLAE